MVRELFHIVSKTKLRAQIYLENVDFLLHRSYGQSIIRKHRRMKELKIFDVHLYIYIGGEQFRLFLFELEFKPTADEQTCVLKVIVDFPCTQNPKKTLRKQMTEMTLKNIPLHSLLKQGEVAVLNNRTSRQYQQELQLQTLV